jgi:hypothetical protein
LQFALLSSKWQETEDERTSSVFPLFARWGNP